MAIDKERYAVALTALYSQVGSLREVYHQMKETIDKPYSIATWARIIRGEQLPTHDQCCQIAVMCGLPRPEMPIEEMVGNVKRWHVIGDAPIIGVLMSQGGSLTYVPADKDDIQVTAKGSVPRRQRKPDRSVRVRLDPDLANMVLDLIQIWHDDSMLDPIDRQGLRSLADRIQTQLDRKQDKE